jgi:hypothetical protein
MYFVDIYRIPVVHRAARPRAVNMTTGALTAVPLAAPELRTGSLIFVP